MVTARVLVVVNEMSYFIPIVCLALPCLALPCLALPCLALPCLALPCLALPCLALPCLALPCLALPCLALPCLALPCLALPCLALPCLALPCLALPCLAYPVVSVDRWGTTDVLATSSLHSSRLSAFLMAAPSVKPVHSRMLSSHLFFCLYNTRGHFFSLFERLLLDAKDFLHDVTIIHSTGVSNCPNERKERSTLQSMTLSPRFLFVTSSIKSKFQVNIQKVMFIKKRLL